MFYLTSQPVPVVTGSSLVIGPGFFFWRLAEMAPNQKDVELQTSEIIKHLLEDEFDVAYIQCSFSQVETDSPAGSDG